MGNSQPKQYSNLIRPFSQKQWLIKPSAHHPQQLWKSTITQRSYLAFPVSSSMTHEQSQLELLQFRKLNSSHLVGAEGLFVGEEREYCAVRNNCHLLVEDVVCRLKDVRGLLELGQGLAVLHSVLSSYRILSYVFGPLATSDQMVFFNQVGVPKVWISEDLAAHRPSPTTQEKAKTVEQRSYFCVQLILSVVEQAMCTKFPPDLRRLFESAVDFSQGEEVVLSYCSQEGIELDRRIDLGELWRRSQKQTSTPQGVPILRLPTTDRTCQTGTDRQTHHIPHLSIISNRASSQSRPNSLGPCSPLHQVGRHKFGFPVMRPKHSAVTSVSTRRQTVNRHLDLSYNQY